MAENFNLIWGSNASQSTTWSDSDYQRGWETVGDTPPTAQQFDALQRRNDLKAQELNNTIAPIAEANDANNRKPQTVYNVGDMQYDSQLPTGWYLLCTVGGTSGDGDITFPTPLTEDVSVMDGTVVWRLHKLSTSVANIDSLEKSLAESTGYGIVSGCEPTISGLTVTVGAGVTHLADGTRKEIAETNVTLDAADSTNPRIDLVYIDSTGTVAKVTGTAVASPVVPSVPTGGISVCNVTIAAGASTGTVNHVQTIAPNLANYGIVNVKDYGAVGDGVTDDTAAIQNVLDSHNVIYIPQGEYFITSTLVIKNSNTKIFGEGKSSKLIKSKDNEILLSASSGLSNIVIKSLYFGVEKNTPSYTQSKQLVAINNCSFIDFIDCEFNSYNGEGKQTLFGHLQTSSSDDVLVKNCSFFGSYGQCCGAQDGIGDGVHGKRQRFINNLLSGFVDTGIGVWTNASDVLIDGNVFLGNNDTSLNYDGVSIDLAGGTNVLVSNNLFIGGNKGVRCLHNLTYYNKNISIENNIFKNQVKVMESAHSIKIYDNPTISVGNNIFVNDSKNATTGIYIGITNNNDVNGEKVGRDFPIYNNKFIGMEYPLNFDCGGGLQISANIINNTFSNIKTVLARNTIASDDRLLLYLENNTVVNETNPLYEKGIACPIGTKMVIAEKSTSTTTYDATEKTALSTYIHGGAHIFNIYVTENGAYNAEVKIKDSAGNVIYSLLFGEKTDTLYTFYLFFPKADTYSVTIAKVGAGPFTGEATINSVKVIKYI